MTPTCGLAPNWVSKVVTVVLHAGALSAACAGENDTWPASMRTDWQQHFASFCSDALYFSFPT
ncbi:hypothetical protein [Streptomyces sp. N35]|uniref:hypothetical protein n=1 Tax=Streptomyces sp. N35 TaxID=2795730 RepID=UPI0018F703CA|nr:hypothetical protein [Streptomyces sp. N35]